MEKKYFSISEVAKEFNISITKLRFWENEFPQLNPTYTNGGTRRYTHKDMDVVRTIIYLLNDQKLTIDGARKKMSNSIDSDKHKAIAIAKLREIKSELVEIRKEINYTPAMAEDTIVD